MPRQLHQILDPCLQQGECSQDFIYKLTSPLWNRSWSQSKYVLKLDGYITVTTVLYPLRLLEKKNNYVMKAHYITVTLLHHHSSKHPQVDYLFNSLFRLKAKKTSKLYITGPWCIYMRNPHILVLCEWNPQLETPHKGAIMQRVFACYGVIMTVPVLHLQYQYFL